VSGNRYNWQYFGGNNQQVASMLRWLRTTFEKRQARIFIGGIQAWHRACSQVSETIGEVLQDESAEIGDIGVILDRVDRTLFAIRDTTVEVSKALRSYDASLASRLQQTSNRIYALRNEAARFLIHAQGPGSPAFNRDFAVNQDQYRSRAMIEVGYQARQMKAELDREMTALWNELQQHIVSAERLLETRDN
jgi:hypothetical protein